MVSGFKTVRGSVFGVGLLFTALVGCGSEANFNEKLGSSASGGGGGGSSSGSSSSDGSVLEENQAASADATGQAGGSGDAAGNSENASGGTSDSAATGNDESIPPVIDMPGAPQDEVESLNKCLAKFGAGAFGPTVTNYRKVVSISVGGYGVPINDTAETPDPELVLVVAGVNVGGAPVMNLLNPNGFYCIQVGVNVETNLTVNLHCGAHLADPKVAVNVGSTQNSTTAVVGVDVLSNITVNNVRPDGAACIR